jgi:hypothetical protein
MRSVARLAPSLDGSGSVQTAQSLDLGRPCPPGRRGRGRVVGLPLFRVASTLSSGLTAPLRNARGAVLRGGLPGLVERVGPRRDRHHRRPGDAVPEPLGGCVQRLLYGGERLDPHPGVHSRQLQCPRDGRCGNPGDAHADREDAVVDANRKCHAPRERRSGDRYLGLTVATDPAAFFFSTPRNLEGSGRGPRGCERTEGLLPGRLDPAGSSRQQLPAQSSGRERPGLSYEPVDSEKRHPPSSSEKPPRAGEGPQRLSFPSFPLMRRYSDTLPAAVPCGGRGSARGVGWNSRPRGPFPQVPAAHE